MSEDPSYNLGESPPSEHTQAKELTIKDSQTPSARPPIAPMEAMERIRNANRGGGAFRKLSFAERCGAFAALYAGARNAVVAKAFGLNPVTVSYLNGCLQQDPNPTRRTTKWTGEGDGEIVETPDDHNAHRDPRRRRRYEDVGMEFEALGEEEFASRYMTPSVYARIQKAHNEHKAERRAAAQEKDRNRG